ncbi:Amuc_1099 family pilus-like system protein [Luteolibacter sp. AS25]|uniref:Amuc_1099 family pilus-like system protein n=1 Tax=Luteolibacter sp. AS25 TaxID=3135776 RepID=UPI00398A6CD0
MSWFSENYEKAALGGGAVIALGLAFAGWQKFSTVDESFSDSARGSGSNDPAVESADSVATAKSSFELKRQWRQGADGSRPVDLFTGVPLFVNKNDKSNPVDLIEGSMVHDPIPNQWWIENRLDPGFGDSPERDADEDGFSNLAEFQSETDPNDARDYPPLISKLRYVGDEAVEWYVRPGFAGANGEYTFEYGDSLRRSAKVGAADPIPVGGLFFDEGPIKNRFKFVGSEETKEMNERMKTEVDVTMISIEDQKANKKGTVYKIPAKFRKAEVRNYSHFDRTAVLSLEALGRDGQEFKVEEKTTFSLPPGKDAKEFKIIEVTPEKIIVEITKAEGDIQLHEILKGSTGPQAQ